MGLFDRMISRVVQLLGVFSSPELNTLHTASTGHALKRILDRGIVIKTVVDVGASNGMWTSMCMKYLPVASYLLVEAQACHQNALDAFCANHKRVQYMLSAAGDYNGTCYFDDGDPFGGVASHECVDSSQPVIPMTTLDNALKTVRLSGPYLLKLDTHGFEVPILDGAIDLLKNANLVVIETYVFKLSKNALLFHEICTYMASHGFRVIDFSEPLWREKDKALWQFDLFFVREDNPVFSDNTYC